jgi:pantoate--beta-alanine ligase
LRVLDSIIDLRTYRRELTGHVGVVLTMGYLHEGHVSLVRAARAENDHVLATIFVNPTQFGPNEDLAAYPRNLPRDLEMLQAAGVDAVFTPTPAMMYPPGYQTYITVETVTQEKEGGIRPGHFRGVATVVAKLFNLTQPTRTYFGQKDAQQVAVIRRMAYDLNFPLEVRVGPIVRETDGLAMSSRNIFLSPEHRQAARVLNRALQAAGEAYATGEHQPDVLRQITADMIASEPLAALDYVSLSDARTLSEQTTPSEAPLLLSVAARIGKPRLLDNILLPLALNTLEGASATLGVE